MKGCGVDCSGDDDCGTGGASCCKAEAGVRSTAAERGDEVDEALHKVRKRPVRLVMARVIMMFADEREI